MAKKEKKNLNAQVSDDLLESASGGYVFYAGEYAGDEYNPWEVIDDENGNVLGRFATENQAKRMAVRKGQTTAKINSWDELYRLRNT